MVTWVDYSVPFLHATDFLKVRFECVTVPHVVIWKGLVSLLSVGVFALYGVVGQVERFVEVVQVEGLAAES